MENKTKHTGFKMHFFSKLAKREQIGLSLAAAVLIVVCLDRFIASNLIIKYKQNSQEINIKEKQLKVNLRNLKQKKEIDKRYEKYTKYIQTTDSDEKNIALIFKEIEQLASKAQVTLVNTKDFPAQDNIFYRKYIVEIEAQGSMEHLMDFFQRINVSAKQLLRIDRLNLRTKSQDSATIKADLVISRIMLTPKF